MVFSSFDFYVFLAIVLLYLAVVRPWKLQRPFLLVMSYVFYGWWDWRFTGLLFATTVVDYAVGLGLGRLELGKHRRALLAVSLTSNLSVLGFFKYYNFFASSADHLLDGFGLHVPNLHVILPIGISFYTFQSMSYTIDVYRRHMKPVKSFMDFALTVSFFPQLVAGPIIRAADFIPQLGGDIRFTKSNLSRGFQMFLSGAVKKILIADTLSVFVDKVFANPSVFDSATIAWAVLAYTVQLYCDFAGYSDMAIGCARMMGFDYRENFNMPYLARSITEFWRRWHMSLSTWLRDYLYISLGGNRVPQWRVYVNLLATMLLGGLWHGASWNFVVWGAMHGVVLAAEKAVFRTPFTDKTPWKWWHIFPWAATMLWVMAAWVLFRAPSWHHASVIFRKLTHPELGITWIYSALWTSLLAMAVGHAIMIWNREERLYIRLATVHGAFIVTVVLLAIALYGPLGVTPFVYFQF